jgi:hypothetical protein
MPKGMTHKAIVFFRTIQKKEQAGNQCIFVGHGFTVRGKNILFCHSERSEESLFDLSVRKKIRRDFSPRSE